ncbi:hypothetical protein CLCR_01361 [Cladophialophora carrionii]|uniref:Uncharacterized protein n=1 Tax=Cladophialophora carrionii TaxID=86049 RepID=A0A1C1CCB6_9EURO|nr:hypothetical protein CLCR_01361 [Cladophialophora carrionii]
MASKTVRADETSGTVRARSGRRPKVVAVDILLRRDGIVWRFKFWGIETFHTLSAALRSPERKKSSLKHCGQREAWSRMEAL